MAWIVLLLLVDEVCSNIKNPIRLLASRQTLLDEDRGEMGTHPLLFSDHRYRQDDGNVTAGGILNLGDTTLLLIGTIGRGNIYI